MTPSEVQKAAVAKRWAREEEMFPIPMEEGLHECVQHPGFYLIPWIQSRIVVNRAGEVIKLLTGKPHKTNINKKGYLKVAVRENGRWISKFLHRLLAMLFCPIPERHAELSFDELEVNHKDGNKLNNDVKNLEWVTTAENMVHAWEAGLVGTEIPLLVRNISTKEISTYPSISSCGRAFCIETAALSTHLRSPYAGMILADGYQFKLDDNSPWPCHTAVEMPEIRIGMACDCIGENIQTGKRLVFSSLVTAARFLDLPLTPLRLSRTRKGPDVPFEGWIFYSFSGRSLSKKFKR